MAPKAKPLTPAQEKKRQEKALQICESCRAQLILKHPFVGRLGIQIPFIPVNDSRIHTIATNGKVIYFRAEWVCSMPPVSMMAVVGHTIWTAALCHSFRRGERDPRRFDTASDIEVCKLLQVEKVNMIRKADFLSLFSGYQTVEEIYEKLPETLSQRHPDSDVHLYTAGVVSLPKLPFEAAQENQEEQEEKKEGEKRGDKGDTQDKSQEASAEVQEEDRSACKKDAASASQNAGGDETGDGTGEEEERFEADCSCDPAMREVWRQRIIEAGQHYRMTYGELPAELAGLVNFFTEGKINYLQLLRRYLGHCSGGESHWLPPARRFVWQGQYLPSRNNPQLDIVVAVDTSGSIKQENFERFFGEISSIVQSFPNYRLTLIQCDAAVQQVDCFSREAPFIKGTKMEIKGGGGTNFIPVFSYIREKKIAPRVLLYYTDGNGSFPGKAPAYPVIWCLTEDHSLPWGKKIIVEE